MKTKIEFELNMADVFVTALEGGSNYWYWLSEQAVGLIRSHEPKGSLSTAFEKAVMAGVKIPINDCENPEQVLGIMDCSLFEKRLEEMGSWKGQHDYRGVLCRFYDESFDAFDADVVFQYLLFGEVVYG